MPDDQDRRGPLGSLDSVEPLSAQQVPQLFARQLALTAQRVRELSAQLAAAYAERGMAAIVRENRAWDPEAGELVVVGESLTGLARVEAEERDRLAREFAMAIKLGLEAQTAAQRQESARLQADLVEAVAREAGLDWSLEETRRMAQRALLRVYRTE